MGVYLEEGDDTFIGSEAPEAVLARSGTDDVSTGGGRDTVVAGLKMPCPTTAPSTAASTSARTAAPSSLYPDAQPASILDGGTGPSRLLLEEYPAADWM